MSSRPMWAKRQALYPGGLGTKIKTFSGELTGTTILSVVAAVTGKKIRVRAFSFNSMVSVVAAAANAFSIAFVDSTYATKVLFEVVSYGKTAAITTAPIQTGLVYLPVDGVATETTAGNALKLAQSIDISTGVIGVSGVVYYDEV